MDNNTLRFCPASEAGRASSQTRKLIRVCEMRRWDLAARHRIFHFILPAEASCSFSGSAIPRRSRINPHRRLLRTRTMRNPTSLTGLIVAGFLLYASAAARSEGGSELRVCADPNNMPFSNREYAGFENKIAELAAQKLGKTLS